METEKHEATASEIAFTLSRRGERPNLMINHGFPFQTVDMGRILHLHSGVLM
jgi:hypothetical protein